MITQCKNLVRLNLSQSKINEKILNDLNKLSKLTHLDLSKNIFKEKVLKKEIFKDIKVNLKYLNLSENQIESIEIEAFQILKNLEVLDLSKNKLQKFIRFKLDDPKKTPEYLCKLKFLNLSGNRIDTILFKSLPNIKILILSNNQLKEINSESFKEKHLQEMIFLDLDNNPIKKICKDSFKDFKKLKYLNLSDTTINQIDKKAFFNVPKLIEGTNQVMEKTEGIKEFIKKIQRFNFDLETSFENVDQLLENIS
jgi:Leucine-rich repeat (LRR) protein